MTHQENVLSGGEIGGDRKLKIDALVEPAQAEIDLGIAYILQLDELEVVVGVGVREFGIGQGIGRVIVYCGDLEVVERGGGADLIEKFRQG